MNKILVTALLSVIAFSCVSATKTDNLTNTAPKNIIMVIGDGMGPAYTSAYRYYNDDPTTPEIEQTVFDRHFVGSASTFPAPVSGYVTDSAAAATALSSGIKSYNGAIGVDVDKKSVETVLEWAKSQGKKTGVVVTSQINHATPASYLAHNEYRKNYNAIADSYIDDGIKADLYLGGGWEYFIREDRNLVNEFKQAGFHYIDNYQGLESLPKNTPILGLFADTGLPWALDDTNKHRLSMMTKAATKQLENKAGYFMLVEASQIDWGGHGNDIAAAMSEMDDLAKTLEYLEGYVETHPDTLVVITADHSTGGFTIGAKGKYEWTPSFLRSMLMSPASIANHLVSENITKENVSKMLNFSVTDEEVNELMLIKSTTELKLTNYDALSDEQKKKAKKPDLAKVLHKIITQIIDKRTNTGWTSGGHTAVDVPVFAFGSNSKMFEGFQDNTNIAEKIFNLLGKKDL